MMRGVLALLLTACGYHAVYGGDTERLHVVLKRSLVPDAVATDEVVSGVREALAREGALAAGDAYPRIEVEVLREDEMSEGIAAPVASPASPATPLPPGAPINAGPRARATEVGLVARACLVRAAGGPCERDTGDVRAMDLAASDLSMGVPDVMSDAFHHRDAMRDVGKRLGSRLAAHMLGHPTASDEAVGRER
jgi:hypothetical protein